MSSAARVWSAVAGIAAGCAFGGPGRIGWSVPFLCAGLAAVVVRRAPALTAAGVALCTVALGLVASSARASDGAALERSAVAVPRCTFVAGVLEELGGFGTLLGIERIDCGAIASGPGVVVTRARLGPPGARVEAEALVVPLRHEGLDLVVRRAGARAAVFVDHARVLEGPTGLHALAGTIRSSLLRVTSHLEPAVGGLLCGLSIGDTHRIPPRAIDQFRRAGLSHLVAVSGSNVAIVLVSVMFLCRAAPARLRHALAAAALALFVAVVGPDPSVLRAAAMGWLMVIAAVAGERSRSLNVLGLALLAVLGLRPALVWSLGLHLSAAATLGLVLWMRPVTAALAPLPRPFAAVAAATLAAQTAVLPILVLTFGEVSVVAPVANIVAAPAVAPATVLSLAAAVIGLVSEALGSALGSAAAPFARWILWVGEWAGGWDRAVARVDPGQARVLALVVVALAAVSVRRQPIASGP